MLQENIMARNNESNPGKVIDYAMAKLERGLKESGEVISEEPIQGLSELDPSLIPIRRIKDTTISHRGMYFPKDPGEKKKRRLPRRKF